jgi:radical SAM protein with 4Fe4S-binding SPASM domain
MNKKQLNQILDAMGISKNTLEETNMDNKTKLETALTDLITAVHEVCKNCKYLDICGNAFKSAPQCFFTNLRKVSKSPLRVDWSDITSS